MASGSVKFTRESPFTATGQRLLDFRDDPLRVMRALHAEQGDSAILQDREARLHFIFSPELNHQLLSHPERFHSGFFAIRGGRNSAQRRLTAGLLSMNGLQHKQNRRTVQSLFQSQAIRTYLPVVKQFTEDMLQCWQFRREIDMSREMTEFMLRVTSSVLFGMEDHETAIEIGRMIDRWVQLNHELGVGAFVSDPEVTQRYDEILSSAERLEAAIAELIAHRKSYPARRDDVLSQLQAAYESRGESPDDVLIGQTALIYAAAHLTTAHSLTWALFLLSQHPSSMQRVWGELQSELDGNFPSLEATGRLVECERALKESLRVLPASAYSQRIAVEATELGRMQVPRSGAVIFSQFITHRRKELFAEPEAYLPQRWATLAPSPYAYLPFGAGPRMCLGGPLAMVILKTVVPAILQRFTLTVVPNSNVSGHVVSTMLSPCGPIWMRVKPAAGRFTAEPVTGNIHDLVELRELPHRRLAA